jgi:DNA polymerase I-like protein with 3'-5' exonuclease and polymerase domains
VLLDYFENRLKLSHLYRHFVRTEMPVLNCLAKMECFGFPFEPNVFARNAGAFMVIQHQSDID